MPAATAHDSPRRTRARSPRMCHTDAHNPGRPCGPGQRRRRDTTGMTRGPARAEGLPDGVKTFAVFNHLAGLGGLITGGLPFVSALAVTALWLFKRRDSPFIDDHGAEAVNFQCSLLLYTLLAFLGALLFTILTLGIGAFIWVFTPVFFVVMSVVNAIGCIRGAIFAGSGKYYRYPITVRFIHR